ncbi:Hypothetical predicted protein [Mytilus galloprovincialis]|uniref:Uncharacterized protein n=1 Tax=Mytilus galloprovincialis TaxID=29158 RepID=A0A8B6DYF0_MYTGA|nr:Hypothetical predicted protein [Mytilus galloprovincialis]
MARWIDRFSYVVSSHSDPTLLKTEDGTSTRPVSRLTALSTPNPVNKEAETESDMEEEKKEQNLHIEWKWLVLDEDHVDTLMGVKILTQYWTILKFYCLANGQRIHLASGMRLIFEVDNLSQASPGYYK